MTGAERNRRYRLRMLAKDPQWDAKKRAKEIAKDPEAYRKMHLEAKRKHYRKMRNDPVFQQQARERFARWVAAHPARAYLSAMNSHRKTQGPPSTIEDLLD